MKDYLIIGTVPCNEDCTANEPTGSYVTTQRREAAIFARQITRYYPEPENGYVTVKRFAHDFGGYYEACAVFDDDDETATNWTNWAYEVEADSLGVLSTWDEIALAELNTATA